MQYSDNAHMAGAYGYEQAFMTMRKIKLSKKEQLQQYRRMVFNVIARNQDDHTKNIAFLMDQQGEWSLSPAFDMTHSYKPGEGWTQTHQMSINGKRDHFSRQNLIKVAETNDLKNPESDSISITLYQSSDSSSKLPAALCNFKVMIIILIF